MITDTNYYQKEAFKIIKQLEGLNGWDARAILKEALKYLPSASKINTKDPDFVKLSEEMENHNYEQS